jgi:hypothetical protein
MLGSGSRGKRWDWYPTQLGGSTRSGKIHIESASQLKEPKGTISVDDGPRSAVVVSMDGPDDHICWSPRMISASFTGTNRRTEPGPGFLYRRPPSALTPRVPARVGLLSGTLVSSAGRYQNIRSRARPI